MTLCDACLSSPLLSSLILSHSAVKQQDAQGRQQLERELEELRATHEQRQRADRGAAEEQAALVRQLDAQGQHLSRLQQTVDLTEQDNRRLSQVGSDCMRCLSRLVLW